MSDNPISINIVETKQDFNDFLLLPWKIYKGSEFWVPPLISQVKETLDVNKYPFWLHARRELYIARQNGETVGRIAAIVDDNHNKFHEEKMGFFGFFESINDIEVAGTLFDQAKKWCKEQGMTHMRGPASPSLNDECAFLLEGFNMKPTFMMPYTPKYYINLSESYGLKKSKDLLALLKYTKWGIPSRFEKMALRVKKKYPELKIRSFNLNNFDVEVPKLIKVYNSAWEKNWGFVPMTYEEMLHTAKSIKMFGDPDLIKIAEIDGKAVGIGITVPNLNEVLEKLNGKLGPIEMLKFLYYKNKVKGMRTLIGGTIKEYRNTGIIAAIYYETELGVARGKKYEWSELGWNLEDNYLINEFDMAAGAKIYKKYRLYEMEI